MGVYIWRPLVLRKLQASSWIVVQRPTCLWIERGSSLTRQQQAILSLWVDTTEFLNVILHNALHVPKLGANLVSLGVLQREGATVSSETGGLLVSMKGETLFRATLSKGGTMRLWHRRMGHLSPLLIEAMRRGRVVEGLVMQSPREYDHVCSGCANGKSHRLPLPSESSSNYSKMEALVVVEVSCRYPVGRLLKSKEEVGTTVRNIIAMLERQSGIKARRLRSDNGTEFVNSIHARTERHR